MRPASAPAREHLDLVGDARAGAVDEVEHRHRRRSRRLLDAQDLLDGAPAPRAGLHRGVVGHDGDAAAVDDRRARDDAVGGQLGIAGCWRGAPSSTKLPASTRRAMRSRAKSLPCSATLARCRCGPPARARSRRDATLSCSAAPGAGSANGRLRRDGLSHAPPDAGAVQLPGQILAEVGRKRLGDRAHRTEVDPGLCTGRLQSLERILATDVPGGAWSERAPSDPRRPIRRTFARPPRSRR